ncbi:hypothetical protein GDO81_013343 [Engystomops pustulosus]|uniref:Uncharacterized protein n=1 Tax=Engystomops pustulosus TaxID=76066 RepID=A0AAV7B2F4_ENGPU|nr:hypothetical protein GDO81_013343 [Engystomops pustulosus]
MSVQFRFAAFGPGDPGSTCCEMLVQRIRRASVEGALEGQYWDSSYVLWKCHQVILLKLCVILCIITFAKCVH